MSPPLPPAFKIWLDTSQLLYLSFQAAVCEEAFSLIAIGVPENKNTFETNSSQRQLSPAPFLHGPEIVTIAGRDILRSFSPQSAPPSISVLCPGVNATRRWWRASCDKRTISQTHQVSALHIAQLSSTVDVRRQSVAPYAT